MGVTGTSLFGDDDIFSTPKSKLLPTNNNNNNNKNVITTKEDIFGGLTSPPLSPSAYNQLKPRSSSSQLNQDNNNNNNNNNKKEANSLIDPLRALSLNNEGNNEKRSKERGSRSGGNLFSSDEEDSEEYSDLPSSDPLSSLISPISSSPSSSPSSFSSSFIHNNNNNNNNNDVKNIEDKEIKKGTEIIEHPLLDTSSKPDPSSSSSLPLSYSTSSLPSFTLPSSSSLPSSHSSSSISTLSSSPSSSSSSSSPSSSSSSLPSTSTTESEIETETDRPKTTMMGGMDMSSLIRDSDYGKTSKYSPEIIKLAESKDFQALDQLLQPYRDLIADFTGLIEIKEVLQSVEKKVFRQAQNKSTTVTRMKVCRFILFSDLLTLCTNKVEDSIQLQHLWITKPDPKHSSQSSLSSSSSSPSFAVPSTPPTPPSPSSQADVFSKALSQVEGDMGNISFHLKTPEKTYLCFFDSSDKLFSLISQFYSSLFKLLHPSLPLSPSLSSPSSSSSLTSSEEENALLKRSFKYKFKNGSQYEGEWKNGKFHGNGKHMMENGDVYEGLFVNHKRSGFGRFLSSDLRYEGFWKHNKKNGKGGLFYHNDKHASKFMGTWYDDKQHGDGELYLKAGTILKTFWKYGNPTSPAVLCFEGDTRYIGDLSDDFLPLGHGICIYHNGDRYYGAWVNGEKHGRGMYITTKGSEFFGEWEKDKINGQGSYRSSKDESTLYGKFTGNLIENLEVTSGSFKFHAPNIDASSMRLSTLDGEKWGLFLQDEIKECRDH